MMERQPRCVLFVLLLALTNGEYFTPRRRVYFGSMDSMRKDLIQDIQYRKSLGVRQTTMASAHRTRRRRRLEQHTQHGTTRDRDEATADDRDVVLVSNSSSKKSKMWPPWPFNMIGRTKEQKEAAAEDDSSSAAGLFWLYFRQRTRIGFRSLQQCKVELHVYGNPKRTFSHPASLSSC